MIKLLIVDDESATRNGLMRHINWKELGIGMIQTAGSAQEGIMISEYFRPDVILSDIRMRGMTGVEMCSELHEKFPDCQFIFISGYSDKEYYKAAIKIGAVSYIEKPINVEELKEAIQQAVNTVQENKQRNSQKLVLQESMDYIKKEAFFSLIRGEIITEESTKIKVCEMFKVRHAAFRVCIIQATEPITNMLAFFYNIEEQVFAPLVAASFSISWEMQFEENNGAILILNGDADSIGDKSNLFADMKKFLIKNQLFAAVGKPVKQIIDIYKSYEHAKEVEQALFSTGYGDIAFRSPSNRTVQIEESLYEEFTLALETSNEKVALSTISDLVNTIKSCEAIRSHKLQRVFFRLEQIIYAESKKNSSFVQNENERGQEIGDGERKTVDQIHAYLVEKTRYLFAIKEKEESGYSVINQVLRLIEREYQQKDISVQGLADEVYLTPTYLSNLFKKKTGKTLGETITGIRIEKSKKLLQDKSLKLYHVASLVGYEDSNYFAKIFKKKMGLTPSEYRDCL
ncbi:response regulator transcription factor [Scatolibacter rhodanostii]|uniref:response regulator transcription factor n=1 Tax=Scatolibacter rhodanostii TaxID=2014781 RepID=UPI000C087F62|nr:response regulator [Scatolibacter rhodanostii]